MSQGNYESISIREAMDKINNEELDSFDWVEILSSHPEFADKCNWDVFSGGGYHDLRLLLDSQPQFADRVLDCIGYMEVGFAFPELIEAAYANCPAPAEFLSRLREDVLSGLEDDINSERQYGEGGDYSHECVAARLVGKIPELATDFDFGEWKGRAIALLLAARAGGTLQSGCPRWGGLGEASGRSSGIRRPMQVGGAFRRRLARVAGSRAPLRGPSRLARHRKVR